MRRAGLIAKKIVIKGKAGKHFPRTYWVLPSFGQAVRLSRAKQAADRAEMPRESSLASLTQWFKKKGFALNEGDAKVLNAFFQKADGTSVSGDDFEQMLGAVGKLRIPKMDNVIDPDTGKVMVDREMGGTKVKPVLDAAGNPLSQDIDVSLQISRLVIRGDQVEISAHLMNEVPPREHIGSVMRTFSLTDDGLSVDHDLLKIDSRFGGGGLGAAIIRNQMKAYPNMGVTTVKVGTAWVGRYTWATMGFEMEDIAKTKTARDFGKFTDELVNGSAGEGGYVPLGTPPLRKPDKTMYTVAEIRALHNWKGQTWRAASAEIPVWDEKEGRVSVRKLGKEFLLAKQTEGWNGEIQLKEGNAAYDRMRAYLKIEDPVKTANKLRAEAQDVLFQAHLAAAEENQDLSVKHQSKASLLVREANRLEQEQASQKAIYTARAKAYQALTSKELAAEDERARDLAKGLSKPLPEVSEFAKLGPNGLSFDLEQRFKAANSEATDHTLSSAVREAARADRDLLSAEGKLAELKERQAMVASRGSEYDVREYRMRRAQLEVQRNTARNRWIAMQQLADASPRQAEAPQPPVLTKRQQEQKENTEREERNKAAALADVNRRAAELTEKRNAGASESVLRAAELRYEASRATLTQLRNMTDGEAFDEFEEMDRAYNQRKVEAARGLSKGLQALARVRRSTPPKEDVTPRGAHQTEDDRRVINSNLRNLKKMEARAVEELKRIEKSGTEAEKRAAKSRLLMTRNLLASQRQSSERTPKTPAEAARIRARQESLYDGSGMPEPIQALFYETA